MITLSEDELTEVVYKAFLEGLGAQATGLYPNDRFMMGWARQYAQRIVAGEEKLHGAPALDKYANARPD